MAFTGSVGRDPFRLGDLDLLTVEAKAGFLRLNADRSIMYSIATGPDGRGLAKAFKRQQSRANWSRLIFKKRQGRACATSIWIERNVGCWEPVTVMPCFPFPFEWGWRD